MRWLRESRLVSRWPESISGVFERWDSFELESVRRQTLLMERRQLRSLALVLNRLSNGLLYPLVAILMLLLLGRSVVPAVIVALCSVVAAHLIYPVTKRHCSRIRPFERDSTISSLLKPLDKHSFPSGHAMTATAAFLPLSAAVPSLSPVAILAVTMIGWARMAAGHHYPSDIAAGILLGSLTSGAGALWLLHG